MRVEPIIILIIFDQAQKRFAQYFQPGYVIALRRVYTVASHTHRNAARAQVLHLTCAVHPTNALHPTHVLHRANALHRRTRWTRRTR